MNFAENLNSNSKVFAGPFYKNNFIYLFLTVLGLCCCAGFSLVAVSGDYSVVAVYEVLIAVVSLALGAPVQGAQASTVGAPRLQSTGSIHC